MRDRPSARPLATSDDANKSSDDEIPPKETEIVGTNSASSGNRTALQAKLDDWSDMNEKALAIKQREV